MSQKTSGLKMPGKVVGRPTGLPHPSGLLQPKTSAGVPAKAQSALEKSARAAGLSGNIAGKYASELLKKFPGPDLADSTTPVDDFKIGDTVYVGGTKRGRIAFIGEAQFAAGEWAGVVLDQPVGKNDGSVAGVRYFQCEAKKGVFSRISKLSHSFVDGGIHGPAPAPSSGGSGDKVSTSSMAESANGTATGSSSARSQTPTALTPTTPAASVAAKPKTSGLMKKGTISGSQTNLAKSSPHGSSSNIATDIASNYPHLRLGERCIVSGSKIGVLRYIGCTDFAKGDWVGVELDDANGKNDGSVQGKRYYDCKPMHGLFAPVHKVTMVRPGSQLSQTSTPVQSTPQSTPRRPSLSKPSLGLAYSRDRSGSQDSISSIGSSASTASRSRNTRTSSSRPSLSATTSALQKAVQEKDEHIEQLLRERDMERSEVARAAMQADEAENQLAALNTDHNRYMAETDEVLQKLQLRVDNLEREKAEVMNALEEEKRKVEDLQFSIEEETINKGDMESQSEMDQAAVKELRDALSSQTARGDSLQKQLDTIKEQYEKQKLNASDAQDSSDVYLEEIEELTHKISMAENKMKTLEEEKQSAIKKASTVSEELVESLRRCTDFEEQLKGRSSDFRQLETRFAELTEELQEGQHLQQKQEDSILELGAKLSASEVTCDGLHSEIHHLKEQLADSRSELHTVEEKASQLQEDKSKLAHQLSELAKNSGDSSQQLSMLNDELLERDRKLGGVQAALSSSTQEAGRLTAQLEAAQGEAAVALEAAAARHTAALTTSQEQLNDTKAQLEKAGQKLAKARERWEEEKSELAATKEAEIAGLKHQLEKQEQEVRGLAEEKKVGREQTEALQEAKEELVFEKEKLEKGIKKLEGEKIAMSEIQASLAKERDDLAERLESTSSSTVSQLQQLQADKDALDTQHQQLQQKMADTDAQQITLRNERDSLLAIKASAQAEIQKRDLKLTELHNEVEKVQKECLSQKEQLSEHAKQSQQGAVMAETLQTQVENMEHQNREMEARVKMMATERDALKATVNALKGVQQEKQLLESQQQNMHQQLQEIQSHQTQVLAELDVEKTSLKNTLDTTVHQLKQQQHDNENLRKQMVNIQSELSEAQNKSTAVHALQLDKTNLEGKVAHLEAKAMQLDAALTESKSNANILDNLTSTDPLIAQLKEDKEMAESQVAFLNSVIVELQRKTDDLQQRLAAMEGGATINGNDADDLELSGEMVLKTPPRLFCDICDVFDLHDTDDCPKQAMSDSPPPSQFHGARHSERPYCEICEAFGHWSQDCDDEQTF